MNKNKLLFEDAYKQLSEEGCAAKFRSLANKLPITTYRYE